MYVYRYTCVCRRERVEEVPCMTLLAKCCRSFLNLNHVQLTRASLRNDRLLHKTCRNHKLLYRVAVHPYHFCDQLYLNLIYAGLKNRCSTRQRNALNKQKQGNFLEILRLRQQRHTTRYYTYISGKHDSREID